MSAIPKYLAQYAEPEARTEAAIPHGVWKRIVVLPLCGEFSPELFSSLEKAASFVRLSTLAIAVVNERHDSGQAYKESNQRLLRWLSQRKPTEFLTVHTVDKTAGNCFPPKEGVGLARKLGCDIALAVLSPGQSPYLWTTDGDAKVSEDYFAIESEAPAAALLSPFRHITDESVEGRALTAYDRYLHYYREGLRYAGSPYAFHTIGSTIAVSPEAYAQVRGFPKREAGEDFYLLNKVAKVGKVRVRERGTVTLSQRSSLRVPFGTGASTVEITALFEKGLPFLVYHPRCFDYLKIWLTEIRDFSNHTDISRTKATIRNLAPELIAILEAQRGFGVLETARNTRSSPQAILAHCHESFDAFRTLKFIHAVRDGIAGEMEWETAMPETSDNFGRYLEEKTLSPRPRSYGEPDRTQV